MGLCSLQCPSEFRLMCTGFGNGCLMRNWRGAYGRVWISPAGGIIIAISANTLGYGYLAQLVMRSNNSNKMDGEVMEIEFG